MSTLTKILDHNVHFVNAYEQYKGVTKMNSISKIPSNNLAILTCMDTRLVEFLEQATGIKRGEAKIIKNAGNIIAGDFGEVIRSILICVYELDVKEIMVVGHYDCGMSATTSKGLIKKMLDAGISYDDISVYEPEFEDWVDAFRDPRKNSRQVAEEIKKHPLIPQDIKVHSLIFCPDSGKIEVLFHDQINS